MCDSSVKGLGWLPDLPDFRDYTVDFDVIPENRKEMGVTRSVKDNLAIMGVMKTMKAAALPTKVDLRSYCSPIENQGNIGSCTAHAGVGMVEYFERRAFGRHIDASRLFLYKVTRNLLGWTGDTGAYLRTTMAAMVCFGLPPERYWPYDTTQYDQEPTNFLYAFGQSFQAINYYRLDPPGTKEEALLTRIKALLAAKMPSMFGFTVYSSIYQGGPTGDIPMPSDGEDMVGGHAVMTVGYDDDRIIKNPNVDGKETTGALMIRNSWGTGWGDGGYGWLPYEYVRCGLAIDWWSVLKAEWVDTGKFGL